MPIDFVDVLVSLDDAQFFFHIQGYMKPVEITQTNSSKTH